MIPGEAALCRASYLLGIDRKPSASRCEVEVWPCLRLRLRLKINAFILSGELMNQPLSRLTGTAGILLSCTLSSFFFQPAVSQAAVGTPAVSQVVLIDADRDLPIGELRSGAILDLAKLPSPRLNI